MEQLVFATNNPNKVLEVQQKLGDRYNFATLESIGCTEEIPETSGTIPKNAEQKARYVYENYGKDCFAEDTGLEINALHGRPGVDTAHYSGSRDNEANMQRVLSELTGVNDRSAQFRTVIALVRGGEVTSFEGIVTGRIAELQQGTGGFGYDPIFIPEGYDQTFGELPSEIKKTISHRARAVKKLEKYLRSLG